MLLNGKQMINEVDAQKDMAQTLCANNEAMGRQELCVALSNGSAGIASGVMNLGMAAYTAYKSTPELKEAQTKFNLENKSLNDMQALKSKTLLKVEDKTESVEPTAQEKSDSKGALDNALKALKEGKTPKELNKLVENDLNTLIEAQKERVSEASKKLQGALGDYGNKRRFRMDIMRSLGGVTEGLGKGSAGFMQRNEKDLEGQNVSGQSALSNMQAVYGQFSGGVDKFMGYINSLQQILASVSSANALPN